MGGGSVVSGTGFDTIGSPELSYPAFFQSSETRYTELQYSVAECCTIRDALEQPRETPESLQQPLGCSLTIKNTVTGSS